MINMIRVTPALGPIVALVASMLAVGVCRAATQNAPTTAINSIETIIADMALPGDAPPHGVPTGVDWRLAGRIGMGNNPSKFGAMTAWGQVYEDEDGNLAANTSVQLKNMRAYYLSSSDGKWHLLQKSVGVEGAAYREDFADDINQPAPARKLEDSSLTVKAGGGFNYHFWPTTGRTTIKRSDITGVFVTIQARLIVDDKSKPDDRAAARYLLSMGGDYWLSTTAAWDNFKTNGDIAISRFKYVTAEWQAFNMTTVDAALLRKNPPPLE